MTDHNPISQRKVRTIRWRCPECGAMGDTQSKTLRRHTVERRYCSDECRNGAEVRQGLQRAAHQPTFLKYEPGKSANIRFLGTPQHQPLYKHFLRK